MDTLLVEQRGAWLKLTLNRPEARNALNTALLARLAQVLEECAAAGDCRAVLICGAGGNFAAGADIGEIESKGRGAGETDPRKEHWARIRAFPKPLVAAVDGFALGGGFELALLADCLILGATARLGLPETNLGIIPGAGGGQRLLARVGYGRAARLVLTGEIIDAATAHAWGIAGWLVEGSALAEAEAIAAKLAARAPLALATAKAALLAGETRVLALAEERAGFEALLDSADKAEGIRAYREKRRPEFRGK